MSNSYDESLFLIFTCNYFNKICNKVKSYSLVGYGDAFYMFGGDTKTGETDLIFKYRGLIWTDVGELMKPRAGHRKDFTT